MTTLQPTASGPRQPMPKRICAGYPAVCSTPLSIYNPDSLCSVCSSHRADAIAAANEAHVARSHKPQDHCKRGHEFTPWNTSYKSDGSRRCRECIVLGRGGRVA